jgi:hypothetical protein
MEQYETHRDMLNLPQYVFPICMLVFGYPTQQQLNREYTPRFDEKFIVFENKYQRLKKNEFAEMFAGRQGAYKDQTMQERDQECRAGDIPKQVYAAFSMEMARSIREILEGVDDVSIRI